MDSTNPTMRGNYGLPKMSSHAYDKDSDSDDNPNESGILMDEDNTNNHSFGYKRFTNKIPHDSGVSCDKKDDYHERMFFDYCPTDSHITVDDINEESRRKNELGNDETHDIDAETSSVESPRDFDDGGLEAVRVDSSADIEMVTFRSKEHRNAEARYQNDLRYDGAIPVDDDDDVSLENVDPHCRLYRDANVGFTRPHDRDFDEDYGSSHGLQEGHSLVPHPKSSSRQTDYGTTSRGVSIEKHERPLKSDGPPFEYPLNRRSIERSAHTLLSSSPSSRGRLEEGRAIDTSIARDSSLDSGTKKANKKKKKKPKDEEEFDVNGNPKEGSTSESSSYERRHPKSNYPNSFSDFPDSDKRGGELSESEKKKKKHIKLANKNIKESYQSQSIQGHRGDVAVDELVNFINNNQGNKKKKKADSIEGPQNGPTSKTVSKKVKKGRSGVVRSGEGEGAVDSGEDWREASGYTESGKVVEEVTQFVEDTETLLKPTTMLTVAAMDGVGSMSVNSLASHPSNPLPVISINQPPEEAHKPDTVHINHVASNKTRTNKDKSSDRTTWKAGDKTSTKESDYRGSHLGSKYSASGNNRNRQPRHIFKSDNNYKFTDIPISPKEEEFTVVSTKKKKRPQTSTPAATVAPSHGFPSHHSVPNFQQVNSFQPREHVSRDMRRYSPPTRSVTPPPMSVSSPSPDKPAERAFSPSAFPVLGGRRNSTGNVALELNPEDSDIESVKSLPLGPCGGASQDGALSPPSTGATMSYAKIAAQPRSKQPPAAPIQVPNPPSTCAANGPDANVLSTKSLSSPVGAEPEPATNTVDCKPTGPPEEGSRVSSATDPSVAPPGKPSMGAALSASTVQSDTCLCPDTCTPCASAVAPIQTQPQAAAATATVPVTNHKKQRQKGVVFLKRDGMPPPGDIGISFGFEPLEMDLALKQSPVVCGVAADPVLPRTYPTSEKVVPVVAPVDPKVAASVNKETVPRHKNIFPPHTSTPSGVSIQFGFDMAEVVGEEHGDRQPPDGEEGQPVAEDSVPVAEVAVAAASCEEVPSPEQPAPVESPPACSSVPSTTSETSSAGSDSGRRGGRRQMPMPPTNIPGKPMMANGLVLPHPHTMQGQAIFATPPPPPPLLNVGGMHLEMMMRAQQHNMNAFLQQLPRIPPPQPHMLQPQMHYLFHHPMGMPFPNMPPQPDIMHPPHTHTDTPIQDSAPTKQEESQSDVTSNTTKTSPTSSDSPTSAIAPQGVPDTSVAKGDAQPTNPGKPTGGLAWLPNLRQEDDPNFVRGKFHINEAVAYLKREWDLTMEQEQRDPSSVMRLDVRTPVSN